MMFYFKWFLIVAIILFGLFTFVVSYFAAHDNCEGVAVVTGIGGAFCLGMASCLFASCSTKKTC